MSDSSSSNSVRWFLAGATAAAVISGFAFFRGKNQSNKNNYKSANNNNKSHSRSNSTSSSSSSSPDPKLEQLGLLYRTLNSKLTEEHSIIRRILAIKELHPTNLSAKHFDLDYFFSLNAKQQHEFLWIINSGTQNPDSCMGCYAMNWQDYITFEPFFSKVIAEYHKVDISARHKTDWNLSSVKNLPANGKLDLAALDLPPLSMRVRVGRNLVDFPLPGSMNKDERVKLELKMCEAFNVLIANPAFGGRYYSLTPGHPDQITAKE